MCRLLGMLTLLILCHSQAFSAPWTLQGRFEDPDKILYQGMMDEGAKWNGEFDFIVQGTVLIEAHTSDGTRIATHPGPDGHFEFQTEKTLHSVAVRVEGGGFYYQLKGNWDRDSEIVLDLRDPGLFRLKGTVKDPEGKPLPFQSVTACSSEKEPILRCYTRSLGQFELWSNVPVSQIKTQIDRQEVTKEGPWTASADIEVKLDAFFTLNGTVKDDRGNPKPEVFVYASSPDKRTLKSAQSKTDGTFSLLLSEKAGTIHARSPNGQVLEIQGAWNENSTVDLVFPSAGVFVLSGQITFKDGRQERCSVEAQDENGLSIRSLRTGTDGKFSLEMSTPVHHIFVSGADLQKILPGPFQQDQHFEITLGDE